MKCIICGKGKAKRFCPAKNSNICPKCCGEKRGIEINCPLDCQYFVEGQKNHQQKITKQRLQKEGTKSYVKRAELYNKNPEIFALIEIAIANSFRTNKKLNNRDLFRGLEQAQKTVETEIKGIYYEYESENSYSNEISKSILEIIREGLNRYPPKHFSMEFSVDVLGEFLKELNFYIENDPDDKSYLKHITRYHPEKEEKIDKTSPSGLIIT